LQITKGEFLLVGGSESWQRGETPRRNLQQVVAVLRTERMHKKDPREFCGQKTARGWRVGGDFPLKKKK
jgi:hypothetical protein